MKEYRLINNTDIDHKLFLGLATSCIMHKFDLEFQTEIDGENVFLELLYEYSKDLITITMNEKKESSNDFVIITIKKEKNK